MSDHTNSASTLIDPITKAPDFRIGEPSGHAAILKALLNFTAFSEVPFKQRPNPFDDPYVGAALINERLEVIGAHRKVGNQERHAEPNSIIAAIDLAAMRSEKAAELSGEIKRQYELKAWLQGDRQMRAFESVFSKAGDLLRAHHNCKELNLYSTLEPCRDYETQPSCACLICATGINHVYYASDDTNAKGQGRQVLQTGRDPRGRIISERPPLVHPNLAVDEALAINRLFFTTVSLVDRIFSSANISPLAIAPSYSSFRIDQDYCIATIEDGRLKLSQDTAAVLPIYQASPSRFGAAAAYSHGTNATNHRHKAIVSADIGENLVLLTRHFTEEQIIDVLFDRAIHRLPLPATIVSTQETPKLDSDLKSALTARGVRWFPNSFRKHDEQFTAKQHVVFSELRSELRDALYILVKCASVAHNASEPYINVFGTADECLERLDSAGIKASRLTIYCRAENSHEVEKLLSSLNSRGHFRRLGKWAEASVDVRLCSLEGRRRHFGAGEYLAKTIDRLRLSYRVKINEETISAFLSASEVARLVSGSQIDPTFFSPEFLSELTSSEDWRDRRSAGTMLAEVVSREPSMADTIVLAGIEAILDDEIGKSSWSSLCTYLNAVQDFSAEAAQVDRAKVLLVLQRVHRVIGELLDRSIPTPWMIDVVWRWLASWSKYAGDEESFGFPFHQRALWKFIADSPFLLSQFAYYSTVTSFPAKGAERFLRLVTDKADSISFAAARATAVICARLTFAFADRVDGSVGRSLQQTCSVLGPDVLELYEKELMRCRHVWTQRLGSVEIAESEEERGRAFATLANLRSLIPAVRRIGSPTSVPIDSTGHIQTWRGDQIGTVDQALLELSPSALIAAMRGLVSDTDVSTRWAGIAYIFEAGRSALERAVAPGHSKSELFRLRELRREFAQIAIETEPHYWLDREILTHYGNADLGTSTAPSYKFNDGLNHGLPPISDLGLDEIFLEFDTNTIHPEVLSALQKYKQHRRSVALVLPPIYSPHERPPVAQGALLNGGSPPLGLGQIAAALSAEGHYVKIFDAHRFMMPHSDLINSLSKFDYVGFSVVISTLLSVRSIAADLRNLADPPKIVVGGHAPTLMTLAQIDRAGVPFDYLVSGPGEEPFLAILRAEARGMEPLGFGIETARDLREGRETGITGTEEKKRILQRTEQSKIYQERWSQLPWIERRLFRGPGGKLPYEPSATRDGNHREAHIVLSRGCNWGCNFCTEALIGGAFGESRRSVDDALSEISYLVGYHNVNRIQFVDDNVLPPRPAQRSSHSEMNFEWAQQFLAGLGQLRSYGATSGAPFNWRGLMRSEDFSVYDESLRGFLNMLSSSGCNLLAFGVETGGEKQRSLMKGAPEGVVTNYAIQTMISRLHKHAIFSKGYFILGGPGQSAEDANSTVQFAIDADFDLAYFAIYKDFRGLVRANASSTDLLNFGLFTSAIGEALDRPKDDNLWVKTFGDLEERPARLALAEEYRKLRELGFSFHDIIKYNDYHLDDVFYTPLGFSGAASYLKALSRAYVEFYCRSGWSERYRSLIAAGY